MSIEINYAAGWKKEKVPLIDILHDRLITKHQSVLFVGEGDFTFTVAIAAMRKKWDGIISSQLSEDDTPSPETAMVSTLKGVLENATYNKSNDTDTLARMEAILSLSMESAIKTLLKWCPGVDATTIDPTTIEVKSYTAKAMVKAFKTILDSAVRSKSDDTDTLQKLKDTLLSPQIDPDQTVSTQNVWFQCPYDLNGKHSSLIKKFIENFSKYQQTGQLLLIGLINDLSLIRDHDLKSLLGFENTKSFIVDYNYKFLGVDNELISEILEYGYQYKHCNVINDCYKLRYFDHMTIVLEKMENTSSEPAISESNSPPSKIENKKTPAGS